MDQENMISKGKDRGSTPRGITIPASGRAESREIDMNEIECTCQKRDCYSCRRQEIDQIAERIYQRELRICTGMAGFDIEKHAEWMAAHYRYPAINALTVEMAYGLKDS